MSTLEQKMIIHRRVKRYHTKTKTGCYTCRKRRVKCDESKPTCNRCQRVNEICLGYDSPSASRPEGKLSTLGRRPDQVEAQNSNTGLATIYHCYDASGTLAVHKEASMIRDISCQPGTLEEERSIQFWLEVTGPNMEIYGPIRGLYKILLPQRAHHSSMIRHFLVATALTHETFFYPESSKSTHLTYRAYHHFQLGLQSSIREQHSKLSHILGSVIAWTFEMIMGNFPAARIHVAATSRLVIELEAEALSIGDRSSFDTIQRQVKPGLRLMKGYSIAAFDEANEKVDYQERNYGPWAQSRIRFHSLTDARTLIISEIKRYCSLNPPTKQDLRHYRYFVTGWHLAMKEYRADCESYERHSALLLLFVLAMALLPESEVGDFSYASNPDIIEHVLTNVDEMLSHIKPYTSFEGKTHIETTLKAVLELVLLHFNDRLVQQRAVELLNKIKINDSLFSIDATR